MKTVKKTMLTAPALVLLCALFITACPQPFENKPNVPSGPDPNLKIENGVLKGYNGTPSGTLVIPENVTEIDVNAFFECKGINGTVVFPANLKTIGAGAFYSCSNIDGFDFSQCKQLTLIKGLAFAKCTKIRTVNLPASLETIKGDAFEDCTELKELTVKAGGPLIADKNIIYTSDKTTILCCAPNEESVNLPKDLKEMAEAAFKACTNLKTVKLPDSVETLGFQAFFRCTGLTGTVVLPANLKIIDIGVFCLCSNVDCFDLSRCTALTSIGNLAFSLCKADAVFKVKDNSVGSAIKIMLIERGIKESQIQKVK
ncbi:hypothetical protein HMPREF9194_00925 [Treponema maltophilum ATCC 51939]|uniref:Leucine-rich repeat domain-containing protein n=1 Tax=Treponema maltophilum ATCC 51939 TaxID=1125699 RepID=S3JXA3_TREMA|nr:leucine-rich repeat domain-containing protein [Treponema maltophilum]EPF30608.1 hypothetical protein HMPREF9194_00925 [Treponema maltophilum ATCC 51939]